MIQSRLGKQLYTSLCTTQIRYITKSDIPVLKPKASSATLSSTHQDTLSQYKQLELDQLKLQKQRFYTDKTGLPLSQYNKAYHKVARQNWLIAGSLVAFMFSVYSYSTYKINTAYVII